MKEKTLRVQMLGGFTMYYGEEAVTLKKVGISKSVRLLQMLLLALPGGVSKNELFGTLYNGYENTDSVNRNKNLNTLIYRLRGQLSACGMPDEEYVEINGGICYFRHSMPIELDVQCFEDLVRRAEKFPGGVNKIQLLLEANKMYRGELLPENHADAWFFQKSNYYKKLYVETIEELEKEFTEKRDYKNRLELYARAAAVYPFENWQVRQMRCNLEIYRYEEAMAVYNRTLELYARDMGSPPTEELQECFEEFKLWDENHGKDLSGKGSWQSLDRVISEKEQDIRGPYYCTFPSFVDYCRLIMRGMDRNPLSAVLMFLTLSVRGKKSNESEFCAIQMEELKMTIGNTLRIGDAYTRYGNRHFILMLMNTEKEASSIIFQRIEESYYRNDGKGKLKYYAEMTQKLKISPYEETGNFGDDG